MKVLFDFSKRDAKKIFYGLLLIEVNLVIVYLVNIKFGGTLQAITDWFNLDTESTIPSWFSSLQIFCIGLIFLIASQHTKRNQYAFKNFLLFVSLIFVFLSMDESVGIHERITSILRDVSWIPHFVKVGSWIPLYSIVGVLLAFVCLKQALKLWRLCWRGALFMAIGIILFLVGGIGMEIISYKFSLYGTTSLFYYIEVVLEEFLEMLGMSVVFYGSLLLVLKMQEENVGDSTAYVATAVPIIM